MPIGLISYGTACVAYAALSALLVSGLRRGPIGAWLLAAALATMLWAGVSAWALYGDGPSLAMALASDLRTAAWLAFLVTVMALPWRGDVGAARNLVGPAVVAFCVANVVVDIWLTTSPVAAPGTSALDARMVARLLLAVIGILLIENLFRNSPEERRWGIKYLCFGLGGIFAYDFYLFSEALLFKRVNPVLVDGRGFVDALVVPLIAVSAARNPQWSLEVFISRRAIFHSSTLIGAGVYLLGMALGGYFIRRYSGDWGPIVQTVFLFSTAMLLVLIVFSGQFRAWLRVNLSKHFLTYRYDYREEWLRLIRTISEVGIQGGLPVRVIKAVADVVDSPDGALWMREDGDRFSLAGSWNASSWKLDKATVELGSDFVAFLEDRQWVVNLSEYASAPEHYEPLVAPAWMTEIRRAALIVPLLHHEWLLGFLLLGRQRAPRDLNWEDYDLLKTMGRQVASYLAEYRAASALAEARQFDQFNKRFAFVLHDTKNLISQLSLMLANAEKHKANPAFIEDLIATVSESVDKMNRLLVRLHEGGLAVKATTAVDLAPVLRRVVARTAQKDRHLSFECEAEGMLVVADEDRLTAVVSHLIDNAVDATEPGKGAVSIRLRANGRHAEIEVEDNGKGMEAAFIRDEMFRPFKSTKTGGFGIGAYESREFVRELGGNLDVTSAPGKGTTVRIRLPAIGETHPTTEAARSATVP